MLKKFFFEKEKGKPDNRQNSEKSKEFWTFDKEFVAAQWYWQKGTGAIKSAAGMGGAILTRFGGWEK